MHGFVSFVQSLSPYIDTSSLLPLSHAGVPLPAGEGHSEKVIRSFLPLVSSCTFCVGDESDDCRMMLER